MKPAIREVLYKGVGICNVEEMVVNGNNTWFLRGPNPCNCICYVAIIPFRSTTRVIMAQHHENTGTSITIWSEKLATKIFAGLPELYGQSPSEIEWFETYWLAAIGRARAEGMPVRELFNSVYTSDDVFNYKYGLTKQDRRLSTVSYSVTWEDGGVKFASPQWTSTEPHLQEELLAILASLAEKAWSPRRSG